MPAIGYVRVSTEDQAKEGVSLDNQKSKIEASCHLKDLGLSIRCIVLSHLYVAAVMVPLRQDFGGQTSPSIRTEVRLFGFYRF